MDIGWTAVGADLDGAPTGETITELCDRIAQTFLTAVGASSGPLYASAFRSAGAAVSDRLDLDGEALAAWIGAMSDGILARGGAAPGDKTMIDAWTPAAAAAREAAAAGRSAGAVLAAARDAARAGMEATSGIESRRGRSAKLGAAASAISTSAPPLPTSHCGPCAQRSLRNDAALGASRFFHGVSASCG